MVTTRQAYNETICVQNEVQNRQRLEARSVNKPEILARKSFPQKPELCDEDSSSEEKYRKAILLLFFSLCVLLPFSYVLVISIELSCDA